MWRLVLLFLRLLSIDKQPSICGFLLFLLVVTAINVSKSLPYDPFIVPDGVLDLVGKYTLLLHL